jgi:hypothetical protein
MNERIFELAKQADLIQWDTLPSGARTPDHESVVKARKFAELIVRECIDILETEIELVKGYKSTACNDFDVRWHEGKIEHFAKLIEKSKKHFGVQE